MNADALFNDGLRRARAGDHIGSLAVLRQTVSLEENPAETYRLLGKVHLHLGELEAAESCWRHALALDPSDQAAAACLAELVRFRHRRRAVAATCALAFLALLSGVLWFQWSSLREMRLSIAVLQDSVQKNRKAESPPPQQPDVAQPAFAAQTSPAPAHSIPSASLEQGYYEALALAFKGDLRHARALFEALAREMPAGEPLAPNIHFWLGRCLYELGELHPALEQFTLVLERYPESGKLGDTLLDAGRCCLRLGERDRGLLMLERILGGSFDPRIQAEARRRLWENRVPPVTQSSVK